jgi:hypothetical protein
MITKTFTLEMGVKVFAIMNWVARRRRWEVRLGCWGAPEVSGPAQPITIWLMIATGTPPGDNVVVYCSGISQETYNPALTDVIPLGFTLISRNERATTCESDGTGIQGDETFVSQVNGLPETPGLTCATLIRPDSGTTVYTWNNGHTSTWKWSGKVGAGPTTGDLSATRTGTIVAGDYRGDDMSENIIYDNDVSTCETGPLSTNIGDAEWALFPATNKPF